MRYKSLRKFKSAVTMLISFLFKRENSLKRFSLFSGQGTYGTSGKLFLVIHQYYTLTIVLLLQEYHIQKNVIFALIFYVSCNFVKSQNKLLKN